MRPAGHLLRLALAAVLAMSAPGSGPVAAQESSAESEGLMMLEEGRRLAAAGRSADALAFYSQALDMAEVRLGSESAALGLLLHELGTVFRDAGDSERAEEQLRRALSILEQALGPEHAELLPTLADLASLVARRGEPGEAQELYQRLLSMLRRSRPAGDPEVVAALGHLALSLDQQQRNDEAEALYRRAVAEADAENRDSVELATVLNNLGALLYRQGELPEAEKLYRRAAELRGRFLSPSHWLVAVSLSDLARVVARLGEGAEALELATRAAAVLAPYCRGLSAQAQGESRSANELCQQTEALRARLEGPRAEEADTPAADTPAIGTPTADTEPKPQPVAIRPRKGVYRAQLLSRESLDLARAEMQEVGKRFEDLLEGHSAHLETIDLGTKGTWHRLQFGDFADPGGASGLCEKLLARGWHECWVAEADDP